MTVQESTGIPQFKGQKCYFVHLSLQYYGTKHNPLLQKLIEKKKRNSLEYLLKMYKYLFLWNDNDLVLCCSDGSHPAPPPPTTPTPPYQPDEAQRWEEEEEERLTEIIPSVPPRQGSRYQPSRHSNEPIRFRNWANKAFIMSWQGSWNEPARLLNWANKANVIN